MSTLPVLKKLFKCPRCDSPEGYFMRANCRTYVEVQVLRGQERQVGPIHPPAKLGPDSPGKYCLACRKPVTTYVNKHFGPPPATA